MGFLIFIECKAIDVKVNFLQCTALSGRDLAITTIGYVMHIV